MMRYKNCAYIRKIFLCFGIVILGLWLMSCKLFAGILYPKVVYDFIEIGSPPYSSNMRLEAGEKYPQAIMFDFVYAVFTTSLVPKIFVNKLYNKWYVREMSYEWNNKKGVFLENATFILPPEEFLERNGWYWRPDAGRHFFHVNFEKIFKKTKKGDRFNFKLILHYSFDDEPEITQILEYEVIVSEGHLVTPFMGF